MKNILFYCCVFLFAFIPLYPKIPLADVLPGYIVKVRLEDIAVGVTFLVWLRVITKERAVFRALPTFGIIGYGVVGLFSIFLGIVLTNTIPLQLLHIGKSGLHYIRYLEYFMMYLFFFTAVRTRKHVVILLSTMLLVVMGVVGYGLGQKYLEFPVFSTMNREYSKGQALTLQSGARPQSTFGGHYDMAAYFVIVLPILLSCGIAYFFWGKKPRAYVITSLLLVSFVAGLFMLVLSGSKVSLFGFGVAALLTFFSYWQKIPSQQLRLAVLVCAVLLGVGGSVLGWRILPQATQQKILDVLPVIGSQEDDKPKDLIGSGLEEKVVERQLPDGSSVKETVFVPSTWSENARKYGLSMGIRLDTLWPQALLGLARNPLFGSGYGTLAMLDTKAFIEADSTDNNFLRTLGETGIFGFLFFYATIFLGIGMGVILAREQSALTRAIGIGFAGSTVGLLICAVYLDVFAASKVAFVYWAFFGVVTKMIWMSKSRATVDLVRVLPKVIAMIRPYWPLIASGVIGFFLLYQNPYLERTPLLDFDRPIYGLEQIVRARCLLNLGTHDTCNPSVYAIALTPLLLFFKKLTIYAYLNLALVGISTLLIFWILKKRVSEAVQFFVLLGVQVLYALWQISSHPLSDLQLAIVVVILPLAFFFLSKKVRVQTRKLSLVVFTGVCVAFVLRSPIQRFQPIAQNDAFFAVQTANTGIRAAAQKPFLYTTLHPSYVNIFSLGNFESRQFPYIKDDIGQAYVSDYGFEVDPRVQSDFMELNRNADLSMVDIGCDERCSLYKISTPSGVRRVAQTIGGTVVELPKNERTYRFLVLMHSYDLPDREPLYGTREFIAAAKKLPFNDQDFIVLGGDILHHPSMGFAYELGDQLISQTTAPILSTPGDAKHTIEGYFSNAFQWFVINSELFILLPVEPDSTLTKENRMQLYDVFLQLAKLPNVSNLIVLSRNLDPSKTGSADARTAIERKLVMHPQIHGYIFTGVMTKPEKTNDQLSFIQAIAGGTGHDSHVQVYVDNGRIQIE